MASRIVVMLCLLGLLLASVPAIALQFDSYYLILTWPGAYCVQNKYGCCIPTTGYPADDFYVKSLMTYDAEDDKAVVRCNSIPFQPNQLDSITDELHSYWSDIKCPSTNGLNTWKSAWNSYGVCSGLTETDYFTAALNLRAKVNPLALLAARGIQPNYKLYSVQDIKDAIRAGTGVTPGIQCSAGTFGQQQLFQIYLCVATDSETLIDCPKFPQFKCPDKILFHPFRSWMLNSTSTASDGGPFQLPMAAME